MAASSSSSSSSAMVVGDGRYRLDRKIEIRSFGVIHIGTDLTTGTEVAVKLERCDASHRSLLKNENEMYTTLGSTYGIPKILWYGQEQESQNVLVMELLGPSLQKQFEKCGNKFSTMTVLMLADQMIARMEFIHSKNILHRHVKPEHFLIGTGPRHRMLHLIDFGLSKKYWDEWRGRHIGNREDKNLIGTSRYVSINTHLGEEQCLRDDMESIGYILMYFLRGDLPWQGLKANSLKEENEKIGKMKMSTSVEVLCEGYPIEFSMYFIYLRGLILGQKPNYAYLRQIFHTLFINEYGEYDYKFDWETLKPKAEEVGASCSSQHRKAQKPPRLDD